MPRPISGVDQVPLRVVIVTMDTHLAGTVLRAERALRREIPGLSITLHAASEWGADGIQLERCIADIARADLVLAAMLFLEDHFQPVLPALQARRDRCDAMVCILSAGEVTRLTRMGGFTTDGSQGGAMALLRKLRGKKDAGKPAGEAQMKMLRRLPKILRFIPGAAQDARAWFPVPPVLARRHRRQRRQPRAHAGGTLCRWSAQDPARRGAGRRAGRISGRWASTTRGSPTAWPPRWRGFRARGRAGRWVC